MGFYWLQAHSVRGIPCHSVELDRRPNLCTSWNLGQSGHAMAWWRGRNCQTDTDTAREIYELRYGNRIKLHFHIMTGRTRPTIWSTIVSIVYVCIQGGFNNTRAAKRCRSAVINRIIFVSVFASNNGGITTQWDTMHEKGHYDLLLMFFIVLGSSPAESGISPPGTSELGICDTIRMCVRGDVIK